MGADRRPQETPTTQSIHVLLRPKSKAVDAGERIPNINDNALARRRTSAHTRATNPARPTAHVRFPRTVRQSYYGGLR